MKREGRLLYAIIMGILTMIFCLAISDGVLGMYSYHTVQYISNVAHAYVVFTLFLIGLPLVFIKKVKWKDTFVNLALYFVLYFPIDMVFGNSRNHLFLGTGGIDFPIVIHAVFVAVLFWILQSCVYLCCFIINKFCLIIKRK